MALRDNPCERAEAGTPLVLGSWPRTIIRALQARGIDGRALAAEAGIDVERLDATGVRVPVTTATRLWHLAVAATGDPCIGVFVSRFANYTTFQALGSAVLASGTLREAFRRIERYGRVGGNAGIVRLDEARARVRLALEIAPGTLRPADEAIDAVLSLVLRVARLLRDTRELAPLRVELERTAPSPAEPFARFFRAPIVFGGRTNALDFAPHEIDAPLATGNAELSRRVDELLARDVARLADDDVVGRVRAAIIERLPDGEPPQEAVARTLGMGTRTLQRRLATQGTSYQTLLDAVRAELARAYLAEGWAVTEAAFALGFSDTSSFSRAFRRWTGTRPSKRPAR